MHSLTTFSPAPRNCTTTRCTAFLIGLKLFSEIMADLPNGHPGCLIATYCYNERLFDGEIMSISKHAMLAWRHRFRAMFERIADLYEMEDPVDLDHLADMVSNTAEGAIIMAKSLQDPQIVPQADPAASVLSQAAVPASQGAVTAVGFERLA